MCMHTNAYACRHTDSYQCKCMHTDAGCCRHRCIPMHMHAVMHAIPMQYTCNTDAHDMQYIHTHMHTRLTWQPLPRKAHPLHLSAPVCTHPDQPENRQKPACRPAKARFDSAKHTLLGQNTLFWGKITFSPLPPPPPGPTAAAAVAQGGAGGPPQAPRRAAPLSTHSTYIFAEQIKSGTIIDILMP